MSKYNILFQLSGSIACFKALQLISLLVKSGHDVQAVGTKNSLQFIGPSSITGLTSRPFLTDLFQSQTHIDFAKWTDLTILCPATANSINKLVSGIADNLLTTIFLAHNFKKPYYIVPAMNSNMYLHPTTQSSIAKLIEIGVDVLGTEDGHLACSENGVGRMLSVNKIYDHIFTKKNLGTVLITSGGTSDPIDRIRSITNKSSGKTGAVLADEFSQAGYDVTYLHAKKATLPRSRCNLLSFETFDELRNSLRTNLTNSKFDIVIHLAAVSDFKPIGTDITKKISSDEILKIEFEKNEKLIDSIKKWSKNCEIKLIAFKLTSSNDSEKNRLSVERLFSSCDADLIVHNDVYNFEGAHHENKFNIYKKDKRPTECNGAAALARELLTHPIMSLERKIK